MRFILSAYVGPMPRPVVPSRREPVGVHQQALHGLLDGDRATVVDLGEQLVLQLQGALHLGGEDLLVEEVLDAD
ncbi:MAG: hypothetical protein ACO1ON_07965, partial [Nocardioides sp.]